MAHSRSAPPRHTKPSTDRQGADKDRHPTPDDDNIHEEGEYRDQHVPLRDPSEGTAPAVIGQDVQQWSGDGDYQDQAAAQQQAPVIGVKGEPIEDGERDPDTIAEEQRIRSEEMQEQGLNWMASRDSRTEEQMADSRFVAEEEKPRRSDLNVTRAGGGQLSYRQDEQV